MTCFCLQLHGTLDEREEVEVKMKHTRANIPDLGVLQPLLGL